MAQCAKRADAPWHGRRWRADPARDRDTIRGFVTGDMTHHPVQWAEPAWGIAADSDGGQATRTRQHLLAEHADTDLLVIGTHYAPPTAGRIVRRAGRVRFEVA